MRRQEHALKRSERMGAAVACVCLSAVVTVTLVVLAVLLPATRWREIPMRK